MPKRETKSIHKNSITINRDSYGHALFKQDAHELYPSTPIQNGSTLSPNGAEQQQEDIQSGYETRGIGLDLAILDSAFLLSQVILTLFMGMIVQFAQSVTAYMVCSAVFGAVAIFFGSQIVYDQKDLKS